MISIAQFLRQHTSFSEKTCAKLQLGFASLGIISIILFSDFFVALSLFIAILYPLYIAYTYLFKSLYSSIFYLNATA